MWLMFNKCIYFTTLLATSAMAGGKKDHRVCSFPLEQPFSFEVVAQGGYLPSVLRITSGKNHVDLGTTDLQRFLVEEADDRALITFFVFSAGRGALLNPKLACASPEEVAQTIDILLPSRAFRTRKVFLPPRDKGALPRQTARDARVRRNITVLLDLEALGLGSRMVDHQGTPEIHDVLYLRLRGEPWKVVKALTVNRSQLKNIEAEVAVPKFEEKDDEEDDRPPKAISPPVHKGYPNPDFVVRTVATLMGGTPLQFIGSFSVDLGVGRPVLYVQDMHGNGISTFESPERILTEVQTKNHVDQTLAQLLFMEALLRQRASKQTLAQMHDAIRVLTQIRQLRARYTSSEENLVELKRLLGISNSKVESYAYSIELEPGHPFEFTIRIDDKTFERLDPAITN